MLGSFNAHYHHACLYLKVDLEELMSGLMACCSTVLSSKAPGTEYEIRMSLFSQSMHFFSFYLTVYGS